MIAAQLTATKAALEKLRGNRQRPPAIETDQAAQPEAAIAVDIRAGGDRTEARDGCPVQTETSEKQLALAKKGTYSGEQWWEGTAGVPIYVV